MSPREARFPLKCSEPGRLGAGRRSGGLQGAALGVGVCAWRPVFLFARVGISHLVARVPSCVYVCAGESARTGPPVPALILCWEGAGLPVVAAEACGGRSVSL